MKVAIVTDSLSNLPEEIAKENDIYIVRGLIYIDNKRYIASEEITTEEILQVIGQKTLKTAVPSPGEYFKIYNHILDNYDFIISLHCPTKQTAFLKSAKIGAKRTKNPDKIIHVECGIATLGLGLVAISVALLSKDITNKELLVQKINELSQKVEVLGIVNSFDYIKKSGRVKLKLAGTLASLLSIKPVLGMHGSDIFLLEKTRNRQKAIQKLQEHFLRQIDPTIEPKMIGLSHLMNIDEAKNIKSIIERRFPEHKIILTDVDPMIATNTGPGLLLITYFSKT